MDKRIAVVGVGAVGGYTGAHMVRAGEDVTLIDFWPAHVEEMKQNGLRITHHEGEQPGGGLRRLQRTAIGLPQWHHVLKLHRGEFRAEI